MQILDRNWPYQFAALFLFIGAMASLKFMMTGFNKDFGWGFGIGLMLGCVIALGAAGWRRGEMKREEVLRPPAQNG
jgi:hypothetical protein